LSAIFVSLKVFYFFDELTKVFEYFKMLYLGNVIRNVVLLHHSSMRDLWLTRSLKSSANSSRILLALRLR
jgi:hypothetical protein